MGSMSFCWSRVRPGIHFPAHNLRSFRTPGASTPPISFQGAQATNDKCLLLVSVWLHTFHPRKVKGSPERFQGAASTMTPLILFF